MRYDTACVAALKQVCTRQCGHLQGKCDLTRIVVTMRVLFASVSETLISRLVEFMAKVLLEYQIPI